MNYSQLRNDNYYKQWYNNKYDDVIIYLMNNDLFNTNQIILEMIHLTDNHSCRYVDSTFFTVLGGIELWR